MNIDAKFVIKMLLNKTQDHIKISFIKSSLKTEITWSFNRYIKDLRQNSTLLPDESHSKPRDGESTIQHSRGCV